MIRILCIPGNGIGPIVVKCGKAIVEAVLEREKIKYKLDTLTLSEKEYLNPTKEQTEKIISTCRKYDYILFGAIGVKNKKQNMYGGGLILALRKELDLYINLRPVKEMLSELNPLENKKFLILQ